MANYIVTKIISGSVLEVMCINSRSLIEVYASDSYRYRKGEVVAVVNNHVVS
jgi:hypothetical protein